MKISFLIPTMNTGEYVIELVDSLLDKCDFSKNDKEIIILDNASTDTHIQKVTDYIKQLDKPFIKYNLNITNLGVGGAFNKMINEYSTGDYIIRLDSDTVAMQKDFDEQLISILDKYKDIGLVSCKTNRTAQPTQIFTIPDYFKDDKDMALNYFTDTLNKLTLEFDTFNIEDNEHLAGYCFVFRRLDWIRKGWKFNDKLLCYGEDNIFCLDVNKSGLKTAIANKIFIWHYQNATTKSFTDKELDKIKSEANKEWELQKSL